MPQPVSNTLTVVSGSLLANKISYVVDGQNRNYRGGYGGLSWMSEAEATNNVIFIGNTSTIGRGPADKPLFYPSFNTSDANIIYAANTLPGSPRNFTTVAGAYGWAANNNFFINSANSPIPRIDADGLAFYVDASQPTSYPQTNNDWFDLSGRGTNGTLTNGPTWNSRGYFDFDATDDYVNFPNDTLLNSNNITVCSTFNPTAVSQNGFLFEKGYVNTQYALFFEGSVFKLRFMFSTAPYSDFGIFAPSYMTAGRWYNAIVTYDSSVAKMYINGNLVNQVTYNASISVNNNGERIGAWYDGSNTGYHFNGSIANTQVYPRALTEAEVKQNYFQGNIVTDGLVFMIDANNLVSYPKSGTTSYSLTGSITGILNNGVGYSNNNGGYWNFDGTDDSITLGTIGGYSNQMTCEAWFRTTSNATWKNILCGSTGDIIFTVNGSKLNFGSQGSTPIPHANYSVSDVNNGNWYHGVATYDGSNVKIYINGVLESTNARSGNQTPSSLRIGSNNTGNSEFFNGDLPLVKLYNRALSASEIQQNYQATKYKFQGATIPLNGLVLNLDATNKDSYPGTGTTWYDLSGNSNNGTLVNGTSWSPSGYMSTDAVDDYIQIADATSLRFTTGFTQVIWVKLNNTITDYYRNLFGKPNYVCYGMIVEWYGGNPILYDFLVGGNRNALGLNYPGSNWVMVAQSYNASGGSNNQIGYINGGASNVLYATRTGNVDINTEPMYIGQSGLSMNVGLALAYNRGLTLSELNQIYNATKTRFGF